MCPLCRLYSKPCRQPPAAPVRAYLYYFVPSKRRAFFPPRGSVSDYDDMRKSVRKAGRRDQAISGMQAWHSGAAPPSPRPELASFAALPVYLSVICDVFGSIRRELQSQGAASCISARGAACEGGPDARTQLASPHTID